MNLVNAVYCGDVRKAFNLKNCHHILEDLQLKDQYPYYTSSLHLGRPTMLVIKYHSAIHKPTSTLLLKPSIYSQRHKARPQHITILLFATGHIRLMAGNLIQNRNVAAIHINRLLCRLADHMPQTLPPVRSLREQTKTYVADVSLLLCRRWHNKPLELNLNLSHLYQFLLSPDTQKTCYPPGGKPWQITYEPELIGAIQCRFFSPLHLNIFTTGRAVILGVRNRKQLRLVSNFLKQLFKIYLHDIYYLN